MKGRDIIVEVLKNEAEAVLKLSKTISKTHEDMLNMCIECKGKIIVTGMGKSGHVARKISATMASLGTPSFYIHPGEAAHGDLGMIEKNDVVIMISKSGETDELIQLIPSLKVIGCKLIGLICNTNSTLEHNCDLSVILPLEREACINNLAPTTSTTLTMAFGDAIAVALSAKKNFGKNDFALFHPKGSLGKILLLTAYDLASKEKEDICAYKDEEIKSILWRITKNRLGAISVINKEGELIGIVSDGDLRRQLEKNSNILCMKVSDIMTAKPVYVYDNVLAVDAFKIMTEKRISVIPILNKCNIVIGMVSFHDIVISGIGGR